MVTLLLSSGKHNYLDMTIDPFLLFHDFINQRLLMLSAQLLLRGHTVLIH